MGYLARLVGPPMWGAVVAIEEPHAEIRLACLEGEVCPHGGLVLTGEFVTVTYRRARRRDATNWDYVRKEE